MGAWINLGTIHKQGGDYAAAAVYWEYVASAYSGTGTPFYSLGDLYQNFLHDNAKAEANYLDAIKIQPNNINAYASLYTMYHFTLHDDTKAAAILTQGLKANPGNNYLLGLQAELQAK
jgi:tetratricopeptide (TPR) repeat protein